MEKRNTILLTVIAIATLLVSVVGATFAYFVASTETTNTGQSVDVTTNELKGANLVFDSLDSQFELLDYPGGLGVYGAKAVISKAQADDKNDYQATYNLKIEYKNPTKTALDWELYMVESEYSDLDVENTTICDLKQKQLANGDTEFWYADKTSDNQTDTASCTASQITSKIEGLGGQVIARGKFLAEKADLTTIDKDTITENAEGEVTAEGALENRVINTKAGHTTKYYYLVVKYPNNGDQTEGDAGKQITAKLTLDGKPASTLYTES